MNECGFLSPFPVERLSLLLSGNGCVGADLLLGHKGAPGRVGLVHEDRGCVDTGWRGFWSVPGVPHCFWAVNAF